jgi:hypothetical protein
MKEYAWYSTGRNRRFLFRLSYSLNKLIFDGGFEMVRRRRPLAQKNPNETNETRVVQFLRSPVTRAVRARAAQAPQRIGQKARPVLSSVFDPGPAGFDWQELESTDGTC